MKIKKKGLDGVRRFTLLWITSALTQYDAVKSLQSCLTVCDPIDGSPPGSPVPWILKARTLEWVAISFSNEWKWKVKVKSLSRIRLLATPWTAAYQAPPSMGFSRQEYWSGVPLRHSMMALHDMMTAEESSASSLFSSVLRTLGPLSTFSCSSLPQITFQTSRLSSPKASQDLSFFPSKQTSEPKVSPRILICFWKLRFDSQFCAQSYKRRLQINCLKSSFHDTVLDSFTTKDSPNTLEIIWNLYPLFNNDSESSFLSSDSQAPTKYFRKISKRK